MHSADIDFFFFFFSYSIPLRFRFRYGDECTRLRIGWPLHAAVRPSSRLDAERPRGQSHGGTKKETPSSKSVLSKAALTAKNKQNAMLLLPLLLSRVRSAKATKGGGGREEEKPFSEGRDSQRNVCQTFSTRFVLLTLLATGGMLIG